MTRCYGCSRNGEHSAGWLNCSDFPVLALSQKKKIKIKKHTLMQVIGGRRKEGFWRGSVQTYFLEKSVLCARSLNCEGFKGHRHNPAVKELLNCGRLWTGCSRRKLWVLLGADVKLKAKGQGCFATLKKNKWRGIWMRESLVFMKWLWWKRD